MLGQVEVGAKGNEIPTFAPLIDRLAATGIDPATLVITADALHCQRAHAEYLHERGAGFVLTAKLNQPGLYHALDALPWADGLQRDRRQLKNWVRGEARVVPIPPDLQ